MSRSLQVAMPHLSAEGTQSSTQTHAEHTVKILLCGERAVHAPTRQGDDKADELMGEVREQAEELRHQAPGGKEV